MKNKDLMKYILFAVAFFNRDDIFMNSNKFVNHCLVSPLFVCLNIVRICF